MSGQPRGRSPGLRRLCPTHEGRMASLSVWVHQRLWPVPVAQRWVRGLHPLRRARFPFPDAGLCGPSNTGCPMAPCLERVRVACPIWFVCSIRPPYRLAANRRNTSRLAALDNAPAVVREAGATDGSRRFAHQSTRARFATATRAVLRRGPTSDSRPTRPDDRPASFPIQPGGGDPKAGESKKRVYRKLAGAGCAIYLNLSFQAH
jgi:hypothetical protein